MADLSGSCLGRLKSSEISQLLTKISMSNSFPHWWVPTVAHTTVSSVFPSRSTTMVRQVAQSSSLQTLWATRIELWPTCQHSWCWWPRSMHPNGHHRGQPAPSNEHPFIITITEKHQMTTYSVLTSSCTPSGQCNIHHRLIVHDNVHQDCAPTESEATFSTKNPISDFKLILPRMIHIHEEPSISSNTKWAFRFLVIIYENKSCIIIYSLIQH